MDSGILFEDKSAAVINNIIYCLREYSSLAKYDLLPDEEAENTFSHPNQSLNEFIVFSD